jgi:hypothetical protein
MKQTLLYKSAVILHALTSFLSILLAMPALLGGPKSATLMQGVPPIVIVLSALLGVAGLVSAYGAWYGQKWGIGLTIFLEAIGGLLALPGVLDGPTPFLKLSALTGVLSAIFVIVVMLRRPRSA